MKKLEIPIHPYIRIFALSLWAMFLLSACKKEVKPLDKLDGPDGLGGEVRFVNASEHIGNELFAPGTAQYGRCVILIDHPKDSLQLAATLQFEDYPTFAPDNRTAAPSTQVNDALAQPWAIYRRLETGNHQLILMDTARHSLIKDQLSLETDKPATVYYADSLGHFRSWINKDTPIRDDTKIGLQVLQLSPDAGKVFFKIEDKLPSGFPVNMQYGDITSFIAIRNPVSDTLRIKFYSVKDSTTAIARGFLQADPGYSYSIVLKGYLNAANYMDRKNNVPVNIVPDLKLFITKTH